MEYSTHRITLDVAGQGVQASMALRHGESGHRLEIGLTDEGVIYSVSEDCYAMLAAEKSDGTQVFDSCTVENNILLYELGEQITACPGKTDCEVRLYGENGRLLIAPKFSIYVEDAVLDEDRVMSSSEYSALSNLIRNVRDNALSAVTEVSATVETGSGIPTVTLEEAPTETGKEMIFHFSGLKGERGDRGEIGPKGEKGATGTQGPQGIQGEKGETGEKGAKGDKGDQGDSGVYVGSGSPPTGCRVQIDPYEETAFSPVTSVTVNGETIQQTDGNIDIGTVLRTHQDISGKLDKTGGTMTGNLTLDQNLKFSGSAYITSGGKTVLQSTGSSGAILGDGERETSLIGSGRRPKYNNADMALLTDVSNPQTSIQTGGVLAVNTQYYLGTAASVSITMPTTGISVGDEIVVVFSSGTAAATLACDLTGFNFKPKANKTSWLRFTCCDATNGEWLVEAMEG